MTFLTANYGLSPAQIQAFAHGFDDAYQSMAGEIEYTWEEGGWFPEDREAAMIECLTDADRLEQFIPDYMDWCFNFLFKQELVHDLLEMRMPEDLLRYLHSNGKSCWTLAK